MAPRAAAPEPHQPQRRPEPERPAPVKPAAPQETIEAGGSDDPAKILVIRPRRYTDKNTGQPVEMWVVCTDLVEYVTNDRDMVATLEQVKAHNKRVIITHEVLRSTSGTAKRIIEYKVVN